MSAKPRDWPLNVVPPKHVGVVVTDSTMSAEAVAHLRSDVKAAYTALAKQVTATQRAKKERDAALKRRDEAIDNEQAFRKHWGEAVAEAREWKARAKRAEAALKALLDEYAETVDGEWGTGEGAINAETIDTPTATAARAALSHLTHSPEGEQA